MSRPTILFLSIVAVGAIVWISVFGASGTPPAKEPPKAKKKKGATTPRRTKKLRLVGHVQTADGAPVKGATVFVLPKKYRGLNRDKADHEVTGADGRWTLLTKKTVGCWIGVVAPGYRNAYLDGDTVDPSVQMFLVVEEAPTITVTLSDGDGTPIRGKGVQVLPWPDSGAFYFLPGPKARQGEQWRVTNKEGRAVFRRGDVGPVTITPYVEGMYADGKAWLRSTRGEVAFTLRPRGTLELRLTDKETGAAVDGLVTAEFFDPGTGGTLFSFTTSTSKPGLLRLERSVPQGVFGMQVQVDDHSDWLQRRIEIESGNVHVVDVGLERAQATGALVLTLSGNAAVVPDGRRRRAPLSFVRRTDGKFAIRGWMPGAPDWNGAAQRMRFDLPAGTYDVLLADVVTGRAALETGVQLGPGAVEKLEVAMRPGQRGKLPSLGKRGDPARDLIVRDTAGARLPVFAGTRGGRARAARTLDVLRRALDGEEIFLGPYPLDEFELQMVRPGGTDTRVTFR